MIILNILICKLRGHVLKEVDKSLVEVNKIIRSESLVPSLEIYHNYKVEQCSRCEIFKVTLEESIECTMKVADPPNGVNI